MEHYVYYNEPIIMDRKSCLTIKKKLLKKQGHLSTERVRFRRIYFQTDTLSPDLDDTLEDNTDTYSIYMELSPHLSLTYLEKISKRGCHIHHKRERITKEQTELLLSGQYDWLPSGEMNLFHELYLQISINGAFLGRVYEYKRELVSLGRDDRLLVLDKSIQWADYLPATPLNGDQFEFHVLHGRDNIQGNYRKNVPLSPMLFPLMEENPLPLCYNC